MSIRTQLIGFSSALLLTTLPLARAQAQHLEFTAAQADRVLVQLPSPAGDYTLEAWVRWTGTSWSNGDNTILEWGLDQFYLGAGQGGEPYVYGGAAATAAMTINRWHHVAATWDGTTGRLYLDGQPVGTSTSGGLRAASTELGVGFHDGDSGWQGGIDNVIVWNTARTAAQIQTDAVGALLPTAPGLLLWLRLDEGQGQSVANAVGGAAVGVLGTTTAVQTTDPSWGAGSILAVSADVTAAGVQLEASYPNPTTATDRINLPFALLTPGRVTLEVLDALGRPAVTVLADEPRPAGPQQATVAAAQLPAGCYTARLTTADGQVRTRRLLIGAR